MVDGWESINRERMACFPNPVREGLHQMSSIGPCPPHLGHLLPNISIFWRPAKQTLLNKTIFTVQSFLSAIDITFPMGLIMLYRISSTARNTADSVINYPVSCNAAFQEPACCPVLDAQVAMHSQRRDVISDAILRQFKG